MQKLHNDETSFKTNFIHLDSYCIYSYIKLTHAGTMIDEDESDDHNKDDEDDDDSDEEVALEDSSDNNDKASVDNSYDDDDDDLVDEDEAADVASFQTKFAKSSKDMKSQEGFR